MRRLLCAALVAASATAMLPRPAEAWYGGGVALGAAAGVVAGAVIGSAIVHPYPYAYYPYAYPYYYAPRPYAVPYGYPPVAYYYPPPPGYVVPAPAPAPAPVVHTPGCPAGQFFNTYTGNCDRR
jgi:hypothetical protein